MWSVAVIGAGIGGSTASYFLREALGDAVGIVVFDSASKPGGRTDVSNKASRSRQFCDPCMSDER